MTYASFLKRTGAYLVDSIIYGIIVLAIYFVIFLCFGAEHALSVVSGGWGSIIGAIVFVLYYACQEASAKQATIGKIIFGLKVTDLNGQPLSFGRALCRMLGFYVSMLILYIGFLMCLWTEKKQCLHDMMAGCLIVDEKPNEKQGCAIALIICLFILPFVFGMLAAIALPQYQRAMQRAQSHAKARVANTQANETVLLSQAKILAYKIQAAQQDYFNTHQEYAANWYQFGLPIVEDQVFCLTPDQTCKEQHKFQTILTSKDVRVIRINVSEGDAYQLVLPYLAGSTLRCEAKGGLCDRLGF